MKLTLSKKKPLKITAGAPSGEPDPSQTAVKTVYDPREEKRDQPIRGTTNIAQSGSGQLRGGETSPLGGRKPPHEGENGRPDRPPRWRGGPDDGGSNGNGSSDGNGNGNGSPHKNGNPNGNGDSNGVEIQVGMGNHLGEGKSLPEGIENQVEVVEDQTPVMMMGVEMDLPLLHQMLHHLGGDDTGGPDLFM